ncbi:MAG: penicillin-binding transpeptidase domain-containing protein [Saprospiraceae bacterium]
MTTLDINIQDVAERSLLNACQTHNADHGCAIVMEVKTGKIRAMANIGRTPDGWWETYNYAIGERVEPGSMFKLASFMAMMEEGELKDFEQKIPVYKGKVKIYDEELVDASPSWTGFDDDKTGICTFEQRRYRHFNSGIFQRKCIGFYGTPARLWT